VHGKQTYKQTSRKTGKSTRSVQRITDRHFPQHDANSPQKVFLVIDAVYFKKKNGILVFRVPNIQKNVWWTEIEKERVSEYEIGLLELLMEGFTIKGITVDGKPGVLEKIESMGILVQMCHFHQIQIVLRYITRRPRTPASKELKEIIHLLPHTDKESFEHWVAQWYTKWKTFLDEKTFYRDEYNRKKWHYTHKRLRQAYRSIQKHLPYLFTYHQHRGMPNTTNSLEGTFAHIKDKIRFHRGLRWDRKMKVIAELLGP
jgi:hypothetical protein